jgi:hypothetical protein
VQAGPLVYVDLVGYVRDYVGRLPGVSQQEGPTLSRRCCGYNILGNHKITY